MKLKLKKINLLCHNEKRKKRPRSFIKADSYPESACSTENINNITIKEQVLTKHSIQLNTENNVTKKRGIRF